MKKKIKVMQIILDLGTGGVEKFMVDLALHMDNAKYDTSVVCLVSKKNSIFENVLERNKIKVTYLDMSMKYFDLTTMWKLYKIIKNEKPDVVHVHTYIMKMVLLPILLNKIPVKIHTVHVPAEVESKECSKTALKLAYKVGKVVPVGVSKSVKEGLEKLFNIEEAKLIYNGIDLNKFNNFRIEETKNKSVKFINIARFMPEKNHEMLIKAFAVVSEKYPDVKLSLVGKGKLQDNMKSMVKELGIEEKVEFLDLREDIPELLNESDVFVLTSNYEGFGLVLAEAMACRVPVISTNVGAVSELIDNGKNGILVDNGDLNSLIKNMILFIENRNLRDKYAEAGFQSVKKFDLKYTIKAYEELYMNGLKGEDYDR
ncbi:MAG: glycosyltransferase [Clostridium sp.]|nr:glycosyltransferase [Clostridium sp.]